nr:unnamed protein product [Callosobruchus chinensis]
MVFLLLTKFEENRAQFDAGEKTHKSIWTMIATEIQKMTGSHFTYGQLQSKFNSLKTDIKLCLQRKENLEVETSNGLIWREWRSCYLGGVHGLTLRQQQMRQSLLRYILKQNQLQKKPKNDICVRLELARKEKSQDINLKKSNEGMHCKN